jgi:beta-galactosidase
VLDVVADVKDAAGNVVASAKARAPWSKLRHQEVALPEISLKDAKLWDIDSPNLYAADVRLVYNGSEIDREEVRFGVRKVEMDRAYGLRLNERKVFLASMSNHHDLGPVGAAAYPRAISRQFKTMKEFGYNAIRCSHNPYSEEFYDLADEMGLLVFDELIDKWSDKSWWFGRRPFTQIWPQLVTDWIRRDRNHPSVFAWSFGNELQMSEDLCGYQCLGDWGVTMYRLMKTLAQRWDPTRLTTVAMFPAQKGARGKNDPKCGGDPEPPELAVATDFASFNYRWMDYASYVRHEPQMNIFQSEAAVSELQAPFAGMDRGHSIGCSWWGAIEYWGESDRWPKKGWNYSFFSHTLEPYPTAYLIKSFLDETPMAEIAVVEPTKGVESVEWNDIKVGRMNAVSDWCFKTGSVLPVVYVYTNAEEAELFVNGKSLGPRKNDKSDPRAAHALRWTDVRYEPGKIEAVARTGGKEVARRVIETAGKAVRLDVVAENADDWKGDGMDLLYIRVYAVDADGRRVRCVSSRTSFVVDGPATLIAVDNGDHATDELFRGVSAKNMREGFVMAALRSKVGCKGVEVTVSAEGFPSRTIHFAALPK